MPGRWAKEAGKPNRYYEPNQGCVRSPLTSQPNIQADFSALECVERGHRGFRVVLAAWRRSPARFFALDVEIWGNFRSAAARSVPGTRSSDPALPNAAGAR